MGFSRTQYVSSFLRITFLNYLLIISVMNHLFLILNCESNPESWATFFLRATLTYIQQHNKWPSSPNSVTFSMLDVHINNTRNQMFVLVKIGKKHAKKPLQCAISTWLGYICMVQEIQFNEAQNVQNAKKMPSLDWPGTDIFRIVEKSSKQVLFWIFQTDSQKD